MTLENLDFNSILEQLEVNALGALRVTHALLPNLGLVQTRMTNFTVGGLTPEASVKGLLAT